MLSIKFIMVIVIIFLSGVVISLKSSFSDSEIPTENEIKKPPVNETKKPPVNETKKPPVKDLIGIILNPSSLEILQNEATQPPVKETKKPPVKETKKLKELTIFLDKTSDRYLLRVNNVEKIEFSTVEKQNKSKPVPGVEIIVTAEYENGRPDQNSDITDSSGFASIKWRLQKSGNVDVYIETSKEGYKKSKTDYNFTVRDLAPTL